MSTPRPKFLPSACDMQIILFKPLSFGAEALPVISCPADFPLDLFQTAVSQIIDHPEYNSTLILRSETLAEFTQNFPSPIPTISGLHALRVIHRKLLPRRPGRDAGLEQFCTSYRAENDEKSPPSTMVLTPVLESGSSLPYYHPAVSHLAFRYIMSDIPLLCIEVVPLPNTAIDPNSRLYRTCLALLDALHRYGWGAMTNYKKRIIHDSLIPRDLYQDVYQSMRERHKHLVDQWHEVTDPLKHVFEDIGIATYLMLLWKDMFTLAPSDQSLSPKDRPWDDWPRPPGGFLDLGCGNGLLVHILTTEGYLGHGIDLRSRTSWEHYPKSTQSRLHVHALDPSANELEPVAKSYLADGVFIIGNHADELTPWVPVLSTLHRASGYLSIPCCAWSFDSRFIRTNNHASPFPLPDSSTVKLLNLGGDGSNASSYSAYRIWLAGLSMWCGWEIECDALRIPSTRNWALIGRRKTWTNEEGEEEGRIHALDIIKDIQDRGIFKTRRPEGKAGDH